MAVLIGADSEVDYNAEDWLGNPTREEMLEQHAKLVEAECNSMRLEIDRYRKNQAKLVAMLTAAVSERDQFKRELDATGKQLTVLREQIDAGQWLKGLTSADRQNYQLAEQNRHLQDTVLRLAKGSTEPPPF